MKKGPIVVGIAGPSGSGKTGIARAVAQAMPGSAVLSLDAYYLDLSAVAPDEREKVNFDQPDALDRDLMLSQLGNLRLGRPVQIPVYRFETHTRARETLHLAPPSVLIAEGLFALYGTDLRRLLDLGVYVDLPHEIALTRRVHRDTSERGRTADQVTQRFHSHVKPMADKWIAPQAAHADLVLDGQVPIHVSAKAVVEKVRALVENLGGGEGL